MKRKADEAQLHMMCDNRSKSVRNTLDLQSRLISKKISGLLNECHRTPSRSKPIPLSASTPFARDHSPHVNVSDKVMDADTDAELRRVVDNFVSIYEQLDVCEGSDVKPNYSYTELAYLAMLRSPNFCLPITEIYSYIQSRFLFFKNSTRKHWKNAVRHSLAKTMCFTKIAIGRGTSNSENLSRSTYLWCIIPNSIVSFARGDYRTGVDKESGTNTLRWGYMRVNAGQFWDQVGNYIANSMASFRSHLQDSPQPGHIFEQQVCRIPDSNKQPKGQEPIWTSYNNILGNHSDKQYSGHGYRPGSSYGHPFELSPMFERSVIGVPAQGFVTSEPFCNYGNSPPLATRRAPWFTSHVVDTQPLAVHNTVLQSRTNTENVSSIFTNDFNADVPARITNGCSNNISPICNEAKRMDDYLDNVQTPSRLATPPHKTAFNTSDSGMESCGSSPESELLGSCRLINQSESSADLDLSACRLFDQKTNQYSEKYSVNSCDFIDTDFQLDWSDYKEPDLSEFCDSLLLGDIKDEIIESDTRPDSPRFLYETCMKENVNLSSDWYANAVSTPHRVSPDRINSLMSQEQFSYHSNSMFSGSPDHSSMSGSLNDPLMNWTAPKTWF